MKTERIVKHCHAQSLVRLQSPDVITHDVMETVMKTLRKIDLERYNEPES